MNDPYHPEAGAASNSKWNLGWPDYVLGLLSLPITLFILCFAVTGMAEMLQRPSSRRKFLACMLALEIALIGFIWALQHFGPQ